MEIAEYAFLTLRGKNRPEHGTSFYVLLIVLLHVFMGCTQREDTSTRSYFILAQDEKKIFVPVILNDSINVKLGFDTGSTYSFYHALITLDSSIFAAHQSLVSDSMPTISKTGSAWNINSGYETFTYKTRQKLKLGGTDFIYDGIDVMNWKKYMSKDCDGLFNIPKNDTTHIWELNFENNYMEIYSANNFAMPADCYIAPFIRPDDFPFCIHIPLQIRFKDNNTLTINQNFFIDTGATRDIVLLCNAKETEFLNRRKDAEWIRDLNSYIRYYTVEATLFDHFKVDSLRIYTIDYQNKIGYTNYIVGLNFLKRFNVFFDMKNKQLGLQPIENFQRWVSPFYERFHYSTFKTREGKYIVNQLGDYEGNYYKAAGLRMRDEIVSIDRIPYGKITWAMKDSLKKRETLTLEIIRSGKPLTLSVKVDHNEPKGD